MSNPPNPITLPQPPPPDPLARFAPDLLLADRWYQEAGKAWRTGDRELAEEYRCRGEAIHDRIEQILAEIGQEATQ
jgi:hypothetical protein